MEFKGYGLMDELVERAMEKTFSHVRINHAYYNDADAVIMILELQKLLDAYEKAEEYIASSDADGGDVLYDLLKMYETMIDERYQFFTFYDEAIKEKAVEDMKKIEESEAKERLEKAKAELAEMEAEVKSMEEAQA